jgi:hypothetical protein
MRAYREDLRNGGELMGRRGNPVITKVVNGVEVAFKECSTCGILRELDNYKKDKTGVAGKAGRCKECDKEIRAGQRAEIKDKNRKYHAENRDKIISQKRNYHSRKEVKQHYLAWRLNKRALKNGLPATLNADEVRKVIEYFDGACALTGDQENVDLDHFITLSTGAVGSVYENLVPLRHDLNSSKQASNPFTWFSENKERFGLSEDKFRDVIAYLADVNRMTVDEYTAYVFNCYEQRRRSNG